MQWTVVESFVCFPPLFPFYVGLCELISIRYSPGQPSPNWQNIYTHNTNNNSKPMKRIEIKTYEDRIEVLCDFYWFSVYIFIVRFKFNLEIYLMLLFFSVVGFVYGFAALAGCIGNCCIICVCMYFYLMPIVKSNNRIRMKNAFFSPVFCLFFVQSAID